MLVFCLLLSVVFHTSAYTKPYTNYQNITQKDTTSNSEDDDLFNYSMKYKSPWIAGILSAVLPGAGQFYNGKKNYWKTPAFLVGIGLLYLAVDFNETRYNNFRHGFNVYSEYGKAGVDKADESLKLFFEYGDSTNLQRGRDFYHSQRDFWVVFTIVAWVVNILDAVVYAHLSGFNVSKKTTLRIKPKIPTYNEILAGTSYGGLSIALNF